MKTKIPIKQLFKIVSDVREDFEEQDLPCYYNCPKMSRNRNRKYRLITRKEAGLLFREKYKALDKGL